MPKLLINQDQQLELSDNVVTIGRAEDNDIVDHAKVVSRKHAEIQQENGRFVFYDLSLNGTSINGEKIKQKVLMDGDEIAIGTTTIKFCQTETCREDKTVIAINQAVPISTIVKNKTRKPMLLGLIIALFILIIGMIAVAFFIQKPLQNNPEVIPPEPKAGEHSVPPVQTIPANSKNAIELVTQVEVDIKIAERFYREKNLQLGNLYNSIAKRQEVLRKLSSITPHPSLYDEVAAKIKEEEKELDDKITEENNTAYFYYKNGDKQSLIEHLYNVLKLIPDQRDPRNKKAKDRILKYES